MIDVEMLVMEAVRDRYCCAQIIMAVGLEVKGMTNPDLIRVMRGLCYGIYGRNICGALSGAACMLYLFHEQYAAVLVPELFSWFESKYGGVNCRDLIGNGLRNSPKCLDLVTQTCEYCFELLEQNGLLEEKL
jgi:hypothetical protein